jgi:hypothetical protein
MRSTLDDLGGDPQDLHDKRQEPWRGVGLGGAAACVVGSMSIRSRDHGIVGVGTAGAG